MLTLFCACLFLNIPALAQNSENVQKDPTPEEFVSERIQRNPKKDYLSLSIENDFLGGGTDQFYTSGLRLTYFNSGTDVPVFMDELADYIPTFDINKTTSTFFTIGQNIYTPQDIAIARNQNDDRPWAGFLYGSVGLFTLDDNHVDELEFTLGMVGPKSLGEQTQKFIHRHVSDSSIPKGWKNQLEFEPGVILSWQRRWPRAYTYDLAGYRFRAEPNIAVSLGNIYTYASTGIMLSLAPNKGILQDTQPRVRPALPGSGYFETPEDNWSWQIFAGADGRALARNIFLDGNTFSDSHSVEKEHFVADLTAGVAFTFDDYRLAYSINHRSDEFKGQGDDSIFGSLTLSTRF
ncbi:MAG: lipid A deacylase LpxR family protein [Alphaproteobacteria bacterium]